MEKPCIFFHRLHCDCLSQKIPLKHIGVCGCHLTEYEKMICKVLWEHFLLNSSLQDPIHSTVLHVCNFCSGSCSPIKMQEIYVV